MYTNDDMSNKNQNKDKNQKFMTLKMIMMAKTILNKVTMMSIIMMTQLLSQFVISHTRNRHHYIMVSLSRSEGYHKFLCHLQNSQVVRHARCTISHPRLSTKLAWKRARLYGYNIGNVQWVILHMGFDEWLEGLIMHKEVFKDKEILNTDISSNRVGWLRM